MHDWTVQDILTFVEKIQLESGETRHVLPILAFILPLKILRPGL